MTSEFRMRASDRDRERAMEALRSAYAVGRLDLTEFDERTGAACSARTWGDLRDLTADLPEGRALITSGPDAGWYHDAGAACQAPGSRFMPLVVMAVIWLSIAAVGHVAAAIPLVLLSMFLLAAGCWNIGPSRRPEARAIQPGARGMPAGRPGGSTRPHGAVAGSRDMKVTVATRCCSLSARRRSRCPRRR